MMRVTDVMTKTVVTVHPDDSLLTATEKMMTHNFDGLPVVDEAGTLMGLITQANLIAPANKIHLPTLLLFLEKFDLYKRDQKLAGDELSNILSIRVKDVMNLEPPNLYESETVDNATMYLARNHGVNPTCIVDESRKLLGVITRTDLFKLYGLSEPISQVIRNQGKEIDARVGNFLEDFRRNFLFISRWRTKAWITINIVFLITGILVAAFFMLRIQIG